MRPWGGSFHLCLGPRFCLCEVDGWGLLVRGPFPELTSQDSPGLHCPAALPVVALARMSPNQPSNPAPKHGLPFSEEGWKQLPSKIDWVYLPSPLLSQIVDPDIHPPYISSTASQAQVAIWKRQSGPSIWWWSHGNELLFIIQLFQVSCTEHFTCIISFNSHKTPLGYT